MEQGKDVTPSARKTYVSLVRKRQFGAIQPSTTDRMDLTATRRESGPCRGGLRPPHP